MGTQYKTIAICLVALLIIESLLFVTINVREEEEQGNSYITWLQRQHVPPQVTDASSIPTTDAIESTVTATPSDIIPRPTGRPTTDPTVAPAATAASTGDPAPTRAGESDDDAYYCQRMLRETVSAAAKGNTTPRHVLLTAKCNNTSCVKKTDGRDLQAEWKEKEPTFPRCIVSDVECRRLADEFPGLQPHYDKLPMVVLKADICRLLAVYNYGGAYMDTDISYVQPLENFVNFSDTEPQVGYENGGLVSVITNWFFVSPAQHPAIFNVIHDIAERISSDEYKSKYNNFVLYTTGPYALHNSLNSQGPNGKWPVKWDQRDQMTQLLIHHYFASNRQRYEHDHPSWSVQARQTVIEKELFFVAKDEENGRAEKARPRDPWYESKLRFSQCTEEMLEHGMRAGAPLMSVNASREVYSLPKQLVQAMSEDQLRVVCSWFAVFLYSDVARHRDVMLNKTATDMKTWINVTGPLQVGRAADGRISKDLFAARSSNPCLQLLLRRMNLMLRERFPDNVTSETKEDVAEHVQKIRSNIHDGIFIAGSQGQSAVGDYRITGDLAAFNPSDLFDKVVSTECVPQGSAQVSWSESRMRELLQPYAQ